MLTDGADAKGAANWLNNEYFGRLNKASLTLATGPVSAQANGAIVQMISANTISGKLAKDLMDILWSEGGDPRAIVEARGMKQVTDTSAIEKVVDAVIAANPDKVEEVKAKPKLAAWFVGQVMKQSGGKANPQAVNAILKARLNLPDEG
jgi:aspartyl-tRNA(Asn)/glutamyl-tRNA(Gln) amidotransferase subunit B